MFSRGPKAVDAEPGDEYAKFLQEAATILGTSVDDLELSKELQSGYGCDELEVVELVRVAEDVWSTSLMPNPFGGGERHRFRQQDTRTLGVLKPAAEEGDGVPSGCLLG